MASIRVARHPIIWVLAPLILLFILAVAIFGWDWTGFNSKVGPQLSKNEQYRAAKTLWDWMQLLIIPASIAVVTFWLDSRRKQAEENRRLAFEKAEGERKLVLGQYADIYTYAQDQYAALISAYVRLYEGEGAKLGGSAFGRLAYEADKDVMRPYRMNETRLDDQLRGRIFIIHSALAQVQGSPSEATLKNFRDWKSDFYKEISDIRILLRPEQILYRKGIINSPFDSVGGIYHEGHPDNQY
jgi:hypothetical protein